MIDDKNSSNLLTVWRKYIDFETCVRDKDGDLDSFIKTWKSKMAKAQSAGCQYPATLLAMKLIEKVNLSDESLISVLSSVELDSSLSVVVARIKEDYNSSRSNGRRRSKRTPKYEELESDNDDTPRDFDDDDDYVGDDGAEEEDDDASLDDFDGGAENDDSNDDDSVVFEDEEDSSGGRLRNRKSGKTRAKQQQKFGCVICEEICWSLEDLERHSKTHGTGFNCSDCQIRFLNKNALTKHMAQFHPKAKVKKSHECSICGKTFRLKKNLALHWNRHQNQQEYNLDSLVSTSENDAAAAALLGEDKLNLPESAVKTASVKKRSEKLERARRTLQETLNCAPCGTQFLNKEDFVAHLKTQHPELELTDETDAIFKCKMCTCFFLPRSKLVEHMKSHGKECHLLTLDGKIKEDFFIMISLKSSKQVKQELDEDIKNKYGTLDMGVADMLGNIVERATSMEDDPSGSGDLKCKKARIPCEICGKLFAQNYMRNHIAIHGSSKDFECSICKKRFISTAQLSKHVLVHRNRTWLCTFCGKGLRSKSSLNDHLNLHTKAKTWDCTSCDKKFLSTHSLLYHVRVHHLGEKPFKCHHCDLSFYTSSKRTDHMRVHTGERPFKCDVCGKHFKDRRTCKRHLRNIHLKGSEKGGAMPIEAGSNFS